MTPRRFLALLALLPLLAGLAACAENAATGRQSLSLLSPQDEAKIGADEHTKLLASMGGATDDPKVGGYVATLGARLVRNSDVADMKFTFTVVNSDIVNAMALPGGYVYVTRGLLALARDEAELAGVLSHEIGHVAAHHTNERVSQQILANIGLAVLGAVIQTPGVADMANYGAQAYLQSYSRDQETEADTLGIKYMSRAGYDPQAMVSFLDTLRRDSMLQAAEAGKPRESVDDSNIMATHPRTVDRVQHAMQIALHTQPNAAKLGRDPYLAAVDGLVYGDDPKQGVVRGRMFLHPGLGFQFAAPEGFRLVNGDKAVTAANPSGAGFSFDSERVRGGDMLGYVRDRWAKNARLTNLEAITVNGLPAATASARGSTKQGPVQVQLVAIRFDPDTVFRFTFVIPDGAAGDRAATEFRRTTYSFRPLTAAERAAIRPYRIKVVPVQPGDTPETFAQRIPFPDAFNLERFQVINGLQPGAALAVGQRVKTIGE